MNAAITDSRRQALRSASHWYAVLSGERVSPQQEARWQQWYEEDKDHQWAWQQVENLRSQISRENLEKLFSYNVSNEKLLAARIVPLFLKNLAMRYVYTTSALANTATVTNIGNISVSEEYRPYVEMFHAFLAMSKGQHLKGTICSYGDTLVFSFSYDLTDTSVQRGFFRKIAADGIAVEIETNGVNYE